MWVKKIVGVGGGAARVEKRLTPRERDVPEAAARLRAEAALLLRLGGRVTPRLIASGDDASGPFLHLDWVPFPTLADRLEAGPLAPAFVARAARTAFEALATLHEAADDVGPLAIVHGDLSPANVAVDDAGARVVLLDLELALWREAPSRDGAFRGTVRYCAPEQARGEPPTARSDLFSLAAVLLHASTGEPPRAGASLPALIAAAAEEPLLGSPAVERALVGPAGAALRACLAHAPEERPTDAREVLALLTDVAAR